MCLNDDFFCSFVSIVVLKCKHYAEVSFLKSLELKIDCLLHILSSTLYPGNYAEKVCGSPLYMAPEVLQFQRYDEKVNFFFPPRYSFCAIKMHQNVLKVLKLFV